MVIKYNNISPPKFTEIRSFGLKICHLATLLQYPDDDDAGGGAPQPSPTTPATSFEPTDSEPNDNDVFPLNGYLYDSSGSGPGADAAANVDLTTILAKLKTERDKVSTAKLKTQPNLPFLVDIL
jgi:hypothetical protein